MPILSVLRQQLLVVIDMQVPETQVADSRSSKLTVAGVHATHPRSLPLPQPQHDSHALALPVRCSATGLLHCTVVQGGNLKECQ
jgi:hypothetical protein